MLLPKHKKKSRNATVTLIITYALVLAIFAGKRENLVTKINIMTNHEVCISELIPFNLTGSV